MTTNGNGQVKTHEASKGKLRGGHDPREMGAKGAAERERRRMERIGETRERLELHARKAADTLIDVLEADDDTERRLAAVAILDRVLGKPDQRIEHTQADEFSKRVADLNAEMERLERDSARAET